MPLGTARINGARVSPAHAWSILLAASDPLSKRKGAETAVVPAWVEPDACCRRPGLGERHATRCSGNRKLAIASRSPVT